MNESSNSGAPATLPLPLVPREPPARDRDQATRDRDQTARDRDQTARDTEPPARALDAAVRADLHAAGPEQEAFRAPAALSRAQQTEDAVRAVLERRSSGRVVVSDAFDLLRSLPDESIDLVVTDPPYASLELHRSRGTTTRLTTDWFATVPDEKLPELLASVHRVLRRDRHFYLFCDEVTADIIKQQQGVGAARQSNGARRCASGLVYWKEIVWAKTTLDGSRIRGGTGYHYRAASERILFFEKGKRALADLAIPDVLLAPRPGIPGPAVKPATIARTLISQSSAEGDLVLDPFAGSGVVGTAARQLGRRFLLGDLDLAYLDPQLADAAPPGGARLLQHELDEPREPPPLEAIARSCEGQLLSDAAEMRDAAAAAGWLEEGAVTSALEELLAIRPVEREAAVRRALRSLPEREHEPRLLRAWRAWALSGRRR